MKATGIVRRVDDLGRIVIPKEIRRTLRIREGDPLEIYTEKDGGVIFRKYSPMGDLQDFAAQICEAISANAGYPAAVADRVVHPVGAVFHVKQKFMLTGKVGHHHGVCRVIRMVTAAILSCLCRTVGKITALRPVEKFFSGHAFSPFPGKIVP